MAGLRIVEPNLGWGDPGLRWPKHSAYGVVCQFLPFRAPTIISGACLVADALAEIGASARAWVRATRPVQWDTRYKPFTSRRGRRDRPTKRSGVVGPASRPCRDRKSTRLNSSHLGISYAVFCLKKK